MNELKCPVCKETIYEKQEQSCLGETPMHRKCLLEIKQQVESGNIPLFRFDGNKCIDVRTEEAGCGE